MTLDNDHTTDDDSAAPQAVTDTTPQTARKPGLHRAAPLTLPDERAHEVGRTIVKVFGADSNSVERSALIEYVHDGLRPFIADASSEAALERVAAQLPLLQAMVLHYAEKAAACKLPEHAVKFAKLSLQAQASYLRTVAVISQLQANRPQPVVEDHGDDDNNQ
jgi:hypothetical protein